jgi:hypothetical protein
VARVVTYLAAEIEGLKVGESTKGQLRRPQRDMQSINDCYALLVNKSPSG